MVGLEVLIALSRREYNHAQLFFHLNTGNAALKNNIIKGVYQEYYKQEEGPVDLSLLAPLFYY